MDPWRTAGGATRHIRISTLGPAQLLGLVLAGAVMLPLLLLVLVVAVAAGVIFLAVQVTARLLFGGLAGPGRQPPPADDGRRNVRVIPEDR